MMHSRGFSETLRRLKAAPYRDPSGYVPCGPGWYLLHGRLELPEGYGSENLWYGSTRQCLRRAVRAALGLDRAASPALAAIALRLPDARDADVEHTRVDHIGERVATWAHERRVRVSCLELPHPFPWGQMGPCKLLKPGLNRFYWEHPLEQHRLARLTMRLAKDADVIDISSFPGEFGILQLGLQDPCDRTKRCVDAMSMGDVYGQRVVDGRWEERPWRPGRATAVARAVTTVLETWGKIVPDALTQALREVRGAPADGVCRHPDDSSEALCDCDAEPVSLETDAALAAVPIGTWFAFDRARAASEAGRAGRLIHDSAEAEAGAIATAVTIAIARVNPYPCPDLLDQVLAYVPAGPTRDNLLRAARLPSGTSVWEAARELGNGQRETCADTVPFALWVGPSAAMFQGLVKDASSVGGSPVTLAALVAGIAAPRWDRPRQWVQATRTATDDDRPSWQLLRDALFLGRRV